MSHCPWWHHSTDFEICESHISSNKKNPLIKYQWLETCKQNILEPFPSNPSLRSHKGDKQEESRMCYFLKNPRFLPALLTIVTPHSILN